MDDGRTRCAWVGADPLMVAYHDEEWGVPLRDSRGLFELLTLEGAQAGLSWSTVLKRREGYRRAFAGFDVDQVAAFDADDRARLLEDTGIIRNRAKVDATIGNARAVVALREEGIDFGAWLWSLVGDEPRTERRRTMDDLPAQTLESQAMSRELKRRGFGFVGPTICYALMQGAGMVNDHTADCFRWVEIAAAANQ